MLPVVYGTPMHFPRIPTPRHQPHYGLRVRATTPMTVMPLHPYLLPPPQTPRPTPIASPPACHRAPTSRTSLPFFFGPASHLFQQFDKFPASFYNIHGLRLLLFLLQTTGCSRSPLLSTPFSSSFYQHKMEPSPKLALLFATESCIISVTGSLTFRCDDDPTRRELPVLGTLTAL